MALALYRRYRPDTFAGVIGQDQVTVPLMRALDEGKLTHAYLFSGPRGCGKTSSARILARCVNCAKGPTSHPCGECESCKDLATGGPGSIDVVEIDAASHNGVDDARELRERAGFAPARDRYKIFILDEAHMVTQQGFNALLKIVEEPPEHVMFIFATTEPDKVIGTIRSRTHHYPFRLVPQEVMGPYLETICGKEGITPEPGVLKLAMRAGGGSVRDTLSVLDQLMVGSVEGVITHDAAVALLGFTPEALIGEAVDAVIGHNGEALYGVIQKVVVGGFDPRRFVEDLLARVRDLLVLTLAGDRAESVLSDTAEAEDMDDLHRQAKALGLGALTAMADIINATLGSMTGAISPRMRLELLAARLLAGSESGFTVAVPGAGGTGAAALGAPASTLAGGAAAAGAAGAGAQGSGANTSGGFAGASRGGFAGANHGGFSGAERNRNAGGSPTGHFVGNVSTAPNAGGGQGTGAPGATGQSAVQPSPMQAATPNAGQAQMPGQAQEPTGWSAGAQTIPAPSMAGAAAPSQPVQPVAGETAGRPDTAPVAGSAADNRTPDEKWHAAVAALPGGIREYVSRDKVPTVKFGPNRKGLPCLSLTFDKPLSQHAFALAVDTDSGKKAAVVVMDAVRKEFGPTTVIAPTTVAANGERVESVKRMSPDQLAKVKQQIALAKAGLAASSLGVGLGLHSGSEPKTGKQAAEGQAEDADDSHRAGSGHTSPVNGGAGAAADDGAALAVRQTELFSTPSTSSYATTGLPDSADSAASPVVGSDGWDGPVPAADSADDPWAKPVTSAKPNSHAVPVAHQHQARHEKKHVAVPDVSDGIDPWAVPPQQASPDGRNTPDGQVRPAGRNGSFEQAEPVRQAVTGDRAGAADGFVSGAVPEQKMTAASDVLPRPDNPGADHRNGSAAAGASAAASAGRAGDPWSDVPPADEPPHDDDMDVDAWHRPPSQVPEADPWNTPQNMASAGGPWNSPQQASPAADPWSQPQSGASGASPRAEMASEATPTPVQGDDPWNQPQSEAQVRPNAGPAQWDRSGRPQPQSQSWTGADGANDPWNRNGSADSPQPVRPQVAADEDEYSMNDQSLGDATAMSLEDLKKMFEVKKVEEFASDDPRNPRNMQAAKKPEE